MVKPYTHNKKQFRYRIDEETDQYLKDYAAAHNLPLDSASLALEMIIKEHKELVTNKINSSLLSQTISHNVSTAVEEMIEAGIAKEVNKIRLGTNNTDRNTQKLIELLQGLMQLQNIEHIMTTDMNPPPFLKQVDDLVESRITEQKQRKDNQ
ncbi:hypothetical protein [Planococcus versutus]|uniref:Uncharacterized protein n=1 Tax=Planococcus versutus TaxID=1302659 RepID=A0A1B1S5X5_9BACL|nr:hypothetical protein [Planococcus versutus]ANU28569.1 hypothetical protein I858_016435 [Planococcus versutus]